MSKRTLEDEINAFLEIWDADQLNSFLRDIVPLFELYNVEDESNWVVEAVGELDEGTYDSFVQFILSHA